MSKLAILGGDPVRTKVFPERKTMGPLEREAVIRVLDSDVLSGFVGAAGALFNGGKEVRGFEDSWGSKFGYKHVISVNSASTALMTAVGAAGVEPGDEVIVSPYSMSVSATAALFYGGIPIFADLDPANLCLDPKSIESRITGRTKAIIVVHLLGHPADMDAIMAIAKPRGIKVIEDAAQAPGVIYKDRYVGGLGDIGCFSLNYHKHIHTGEGGLVVTNNDQIALRAQLIRNHGENAAEAYGVEDFSNVMGSNYRLTELQAAIGTEQLKKLDDILALRQSLAAYLTGRLEEIKGLTVQKLPDYHNHAYYMFPIRYDEDVFGVSRSQFLKAVSAELPKPTSWETTPLAEGYVKPLYLNQMYQKKIAIGSKGFPFNYNQGVQYEYPKGMCPVVERLYEKELMYTPLVREPLTVQDMSDLADAFEKVAGHAGELGAISSQRDSRVYDAVSAINETASK
ncbi:DegT/DnrJ/EryC1/StrS aminotransferase family protein [Geobacter sp.]|uniref:DegT/DnrJ/EryC1/StrS family aminotransferase n=1 Tax=Geobacter sp. TaxID=46610 RepID=UPI0027B8E9F6|nr:DegT/DnrJ/EryC1/StrS family aminotransferase [Geobacter sp.]